MSDAACYNCRWWERSGNFKSKARDWGDCHFWGHREGYRSGAAMIDRWNGASPRGNDACTAFNKPPEMIGKIDPRGGPSNPNGDLD